MAKVFLSVGHGVKPDGTFDPGAQGGGQTEQTAGDIVVAQAAWLLRSAGVTVRDEAHSNDPNYVGTTRDANAWGADYLVGVHHDWIGAPLGGFGLYVSTAGQALAASIRAAYVVHGLGVRANTKRTDLYKLNNSRMPSIIWECGRIGQYTNKQLVLNGDAIACGLASFLGVHSKLPPHGVHTPPPLPPEDEVTAADIKAIVDGVVNAKVPLGKYAKGLIGEDTYEWRRLLEVAAYHAHEANAKLDKVPTAAEIAAAVKAVLPVAGTPVDVAALAAAVVDELKARL